MEHYTLLMMDTYLDLTLPQARGTGYDLQNAGKYRTLMAPQ
jgi:hypothetical protein